MDPRVIEPVWSIRRACVVGVVLLVARVSSLQDQSAACLGLWLGFSYAELEFSRSNRQWTQRGRWRIFNADGGDYLYLEWKIFNADGGDFLYLKWSLQ